MIGGVTRRGLPHLPGVPHLHVNRPLLTLHAWFTTIGVLVLGSLDFQQGRHLSISRTLGTFSSSGSPTQLIQEFDVSINYVLVTTFSAI